MRFPAHGEMATEEGCVEPNPRVSQSLRKKLGYLIDYAEISFLFHFGEQNFNLFFKKALKKVQLSAT